MKSKPESKPHASKLLTQFLRHSPTHHPEIKEDRKIFFAMEKTLFLQRV